MKNKKNLKKIYIDFIIKSIIYFIVILVVLSIFSNILSFFDFDWLYEENHNLYRFVNAIYRILFLYPNNIIFTLFIVIIIFLIRMYNLFKKVFSYVTALEESADKLFNKDIDYITLPEGMEELEKKLNHFKRESNKNSRLAKENEQKKDELIVYLAHDIKTPLTSMIGYLSLLDEIDDMDLKKRQKYIKIALDKSYKLENLINELFDVARFNSEKIILEKEEINLNLMLDQIIDDFYPILNDMNKKIDLKIDDKIKIYADSNKLSRVFSNLIKNAINYSKDETNININVLNDNDKIIVSISNKGKEIPKEKLEKIFENFYRLDSSRTSKTGGSGLGLAISKEIVELHGGSIKATSNKDITTFIVELPKY